MIHNRFQRTVAALHRDGDCTVTRWRRNRAPTSVRGIYVAMTRADTTTPPTSPPQTNTTQSTLRRPLDPEPPRCQRGRSSGSEPATADQAVKGSSRELWNLDWLVRMARGLDDQHVVGLNKWLGGEDVETEVPIRL